MDLSVLDTVGERWRKGAPPPPGLRPLAVGHFIFGWLTEPDRKHFKAAMRRADGRAQNEKLFVALAEAGIGVPQDQGARVTDEDAALFLEHLAIARVSKEMEWDLWRRLLHLCVGVDRAEHLAKAFMLATGYADGCLFMPEFQSADIRGKLRAQREALIASGFDAPLAYSRPLPIPLPKQPRQMDLFDNKAD